MVFRDPCRTRRRLGPGKGQTRGAGTQIRQSRGKQLLFYTYQLNPQLVINVLGQQHRVRLKVRQRRHLEPLGLHAQIRPLGLAPQRLALVVLVRRFVRAEFRRAGGRGDDGGRVLFGR